jgi:DNA-binding beta-propeller fold protein YncE
MKRIASVISSTCLLILAAAGAFFYGQHAVQAAQQDVPDRPEQVEPFQRRPTNVKRDLLYVGVPGRREYLQYGGIGVLVFDAARHFQFVKRIPTWDTPAAQEAESIHGIAASPVTGLLYLSTNFRLSAIDLRTDKIVWEQTYDGDCCDRVAVSPDGKLLYVPTVEGPSWYVADALTGKRIKKLDTKDTVNNPHNTVFSLDGSRVFLSGPTVGIADTRTNTVVETITFGNSVRPFTVNGRGSLVFANVNGLLGFEVADVATAKVIQRVEVNGYGWSAERTTEHHCPTHGIALSPDEKELWLGDVANGYVHVFDATVMPPRQIKSIRTRSNPSWITFGIDGKFVYPSSGDVIDAAAKQVVAGLHDEIGRQVESEKLLEVQFIDGKPIRAADQISIGMVRGSAAN